MNDTSYPHVLVCCWSSRDGRDVDHATKTLLAEIRSSNLTAKYWNYLREFPVAPFPVAVHGIGIWFASDNRTDLYKVLRTWLDTNRDWRVEVTLGHRKMRYGVKGGDIQFDLTDMTEPQFLALFNEVRSGD